MRRRLPLTAVPVVALLLAGLALAVSGCSGSSASSSGDQAGALSGTGTYKDIPVGFTQQGYPYMGKADAPVTVEEYSDYLCPFCGRYFSETLPTIVKDYVAKGKVKYVFRDMPLASLHPTASEGHVAARCVAEQGPELFWAIHDELFATQDQWRDLPSPTESLAAAAEKSGADMGAYAKCIEAGTQAAFVDASVATGTQKLRFNATPTFRFIRSVALAPKTGPDAGKAKIYPLVGAYPLETFTSWLTALGAGKAPPEEEQKDTEPAKLPLWASAKGLAPDPAKPGFTTAGDPYKGNPEAKLTVVEFSNFQCPHCRTHALDVQPTVDKTFVDTGKIRWVFKNLPLRSLPQSMDASVAAECAGEQGRFWEMNELLFEKQKQWSVSDPDPVFSRLAGEAGLDVGTFGTCYNSRQALEGVLKDMYAASGVVSESPAFIFVFGGKGAVLQGSKPAAEFVKTMQGFLDQANGVKKPASDAPSSQAPSTTP